MGRYTETNRYEAVLYKSEEELEALEIDKTEQQRIKRIRYIVTRRMEDPMLSDQAFVRALTTGIIGIDKVSRTTVYNDIAEANRICGNVKAVSKQWANYMALEAAKKAYALAEIQDNADGMIKAAALIHKVGESVEDAPDWSEMMPPSFEVSADPNIIKGIEWNENMQAQRDKMRKQMKSIAQDV